MKRRNDRRRALRTAIAPVLILLLGILACVTGPDGKDVPRQRWWTGDGIVVPHDSFPADCSLCHTGDDWHTIRDDFSFDHLAETGVALEGRHEEARCLRCHNDRGPVALFAQRGCRGCHEDVHEGLLGSDCADCHGQEDWRLREEIAMHNRTRFPLVGAHAAAACWSCHPGGEVGNWSRLDVSCRACHLEDALSVSDPDHGALGWTRDCDRCHIPTTWTGPGFNHGTFPLTGAHRYADCAGCHVGGAYTGLPTDCAGCHLGEYQQAQDPDHVSGGFPTTCELCHDTGSWEGALFNHAGISTECYTCHAADYLGAKDPDHVANGFPTSCQECHGTSSWEGAFFDHAFPIESGDHAGLDCTDCHRTPGSFTTFSCTDCHDHAEGEMRDEHEDVPGYTWESSACYSCHPGGGF